MYSIYVKKKSTTFDWFITWVYLIFIHFTLSVTIYQHLNSVYNAHHIENITLLLNASVIPCILIDIYYTDIYHLCILHLKIKTK